MGEIAEMMLDGTLCECCGEFMDGPSEGFPRYCSPQCAADRGVAPAPATRSVKPTLQPQHFDKRAATADPQF